jgi:hypothetical protein
LAILIVRFNNDCDAIQNREVHYAIRYLDSCENKVILDVTRHKAKKILLTPFLLAFVNRVPHYIPSQKDIQLSSQTIVSGVILVRARQYLIKIPNQ